MSCRRGGQLHRGASLSLEASRQGRSDRLRRNIGSMLPQSKIARNVILACLILLAVDGMKAVTSSEAKIMTISVICATFFCDQK